MGVVASTKPAPRSETQKDRIVAFAEWERELRILLTDAVASRPLWERVKKMDAWLEANPWHEKAPKRDRERDLEKAKLAAIENRLFERAARVTVLQRGLSPLVTQGLAALTRMELTSHITHVWMIEARRIGKTNLLDVAEAARESMVRWIDEEVVISGEKGVA
jgi:hypothetical protein